jgi:DNA recombination protein RmuC
MEFILMGLAIANLVVLIILLFVSMLKRKDELFIADKLSKLEVETIKEISDFKADLSHNINEDFNVMNDRMDKRLRQISDKVNERLDENFEKTNKTFTSVLERLSKIDEAQKKIDSLSSDIVSLQGILTDKKTRGIFGEVNLEHIMSNVFGSNNKTIYQMQHTFDNGTIADCVLFAPDPLGTIAIDSKFPLENYQAMVNRENAASIRNNAEKLFKADIKKHIDDISSKYIIPGVTSEQAIMFLPAEAIFAEINAYHNELLEYAYKKNVWITSPTTLISSLTTLQLVIKNIERDKHAQVIQRELQLLASDFSRYKDRWDKLYRSIETVSKDVKDIHTTTDKISKRFNSINQVELKTIDYEEEEEDN